MSDNSWNDFLNLCELSEHVAYIQSKEYAKCQEN